MEQFIEFFGNHPVLSVAWVGLAGTLIYTLFSAKMGGYKVYDRHQATMLINREDAVILDVRAQDASVKGILRAHVTFLRPRSKKSKSVSLKSTNNTPL